MLIYLFNKNIREKFLHKKEHSVFKKRCFILMLFPIQEINHSSFPKKIVRNQVHNLRKKKKENSLLELLNGSDIYNLQFTKLK